MCSLSRLGTRSNQLVSALQEKSLERRVAFLRTHYLNWDRGIGSEERIGAVVRTGGTNVPTRGQ